MLGNGKRYGTVSDRVHSDQFHINFYRHSKIAALLKYLICYTGDLGSRLETFDNIETEKNCPDPQIASLLLNSYIIEDQILRKKMLVFSPIFDYNFQGPCRIIIT